MHRHTTRMVVEQGGAERRAWAWRWAMCPACFSVGSSLLTGLAYRRSHETEADCFAAALMHKARVPAAPMADLLLGIEGAQAARSRWTAAPAAWRAFSAAIRKRPCGRKSSSRAKSTAASGCPCAPRPHWTAALDKSVKSADKPDSVASGLEART